MDRIDTTIRREYRNEPETRMGRANRAPKKQKKSSFQKFIKSPKGIVFIILAILSYVGTFYPTGLSGIKNIVLAMVTGVLLDYVVAYVLNRPLRFSDGALITGLIIGGVLSPAVPWYFVMFTTIVALLSKHILKDKRKPLFNPAAVGLFISATLFSTGESWWSGLSMTPVWMTVILLAGGFIIVNRINKLPLVFSFLGTYMMFFLILGILNVAGAGDALRAPYIDAALFMSFFMLTDPPTSPAKYREQVIFGFLAALISGAAYLYLSKLSFLLVGLFAANSLKAIHSKLDQHSSTRRKVMNVN
ncbi:RnfABCDGE type electron transport complex subunit D [Sporolactobacillus laevolacticus]|uniref:RnfABCDGE type electron transport complex subunit D n=1 Tax=Sporolactobacillus laevolacticus TaxID=33018 RepID=UPI0025B2A4F2|nr:RnfABCDGE type electron transport complex subunit D [Sporolactobacillus laevolacticus]MDN3956420.1 RnfABCDGE type electron transport complex subunit D [Sporolactobacillus laevolacticus]